MSDYFTANLASAVAGFDAIMVDAAVVRLAGEATIRHTSDHPSVVGEPAASMAHRPSSDSVLDLRLP